MNRLLVTGARGFVGRHCLPFIPDDWQVEAVGRAEIDLLDPGAPRELIERVRPTHLLHLAWVTEHGAYWHSPTNETWVQASLELFAAFRDAGGRRAVVTGTCAEYDWSAGRCNERTTPLAPATPYGAAKLELWQRLRELSGPNLAWARLWFLYGPHEDRRRLVPSVITSLLDGERARCSHGRQRRDFLHVEDAARALVELLTSELEGPIDIASGRAVALREVIETIASELGGADRVDLGAIPARRDDPELLVAEAERLHRELGFKARYTLRSGLAATIAWWRKEARG